MIGKCRALGVVALPLCDGPSRGIWESTLLANLLSVDWPRSTRPAVVVRRPFLNPSAFRSPRAQVTTRVIKARLQRHDQQIQHQLDMLAQTLLRRAGPAGVVNGGRRPPAARSRPCLERVAICRFQRPYRFQILIEPADGLPAPALSSIGRASSADHIENALALLVLLSGGRRTSGQKTSRGLVSGAHMGERPVPRQQIFIRNAIKFCRWSCAAQLLAIAGRAPRLSFRR